MKSGTRLALGVLSVAASLAPDIVIETKVVANGEAGALVRQPREGETV